MNKHILKIKELVSSLNCMGTYGLVELELNELEKLIESNEQVNNNNLCAGVRVRYLNIHECDCGWSGNISQLYYRAEYTGINAALECPNCYAELIRLH